MTGIVQPDDVVLAEFAKNSRETVRITRSNFKGHDLVSLRVWAEGRDGASIPTKAGITLRVEKLADLLAALEMARARIEREAA